MSAQVKATLEEFVEAIGGSHGIKAEIARRLGIHRVTVDSYLKRYVTAREIYDDEVERVGDLAESIIIKAIENNDVDTAKWYARMKLKHRGYSERQEVTGKDGEDIGIKGRDIDDRIVALLERLADSK
jgi:hypothetical protein